MDELVHFVLRELAFDGDLGCNVSRLRDFIGDFYTHSSSREHQTVDDAFCAFVWSLVIQQPTILVGTVPPGLKSDVWIAPQTSAKRKAKAKGEEHIETTPPMLELVPDARTRSLDDLKMQYGDDLRIAVEPEAIFAAITGSHIRFAKLSPMVYSALQIITRGREKGTTVVELGQKSKYDQKTCFYLVKQLIELDLVAKVRRGGVGSHFCIHKCFFDRDPSWREIRNEETLADDLERAAQKTQIDAPEEPKEYVDTQFQPIDARHLSSLPLVRARIVKLLKASKNYMHASNNLILAIGFPNPTKTDRRFFQSRIRELVQQGVIEKVVVPSNRKNAGNSSVKCFRLVTADKIPIVDDDGAIIVPQADNDEKDDDFEVPGDINGMKTNLTIHRQIISLLDESGTTGMTLNELAAALCRFDKRTIELLLTRAERYPPPSHLSDLGIAGLMETSGRERRHRYYTVSAYRTLVAKENLDQGSAGYSDVDFSAVGGFFPIDPGTFYEDEETLFEYEDSFKDNQNATKKGKRRKKPLTNPVLPDGSIKQGRPRKKNADGSEQPVKPRPAAKKRKLEELDEDQDAVGGQGVAGPSEVKKRVPRKKKRVEPEETVTLPGDVNKGIDDTGVVISADETSTTVPVAKKRGRPAKPKAPVTEDVAIIPKKRGRPLKSKAQVASQGLQPSADNTSDVILETNEPGVTPTEEFAGPSHDGPIQKRPRLRADLPVFAPAPGEDIQPPSSDTNTPQHVSESPIRADSPMEVDDHRTNITTNLNGSLHGHTLTDAPDGPGLQTITEPLDCSNPDPNTSNESTLPHDTNSSAVTSMAQNNDSISMPDVLIPELRSEEPLVVSASESLLQSEPPAAPSQAGSEAPRTRVNVSHLRRENELYRVIENSGGMINTHTKEFYEAHMALIDSLIKAGEPTSSPAGIRIDKRTVDATFNNMERRGRIKMLKTTVITHTGVARPACVVYLPNVEQSALNAFLTDLSRGVQPSPQAETAIKIDKPMEYGADSGPPVRNPLPLQLLQLEQPGTDQRERWSRNEARANQLFSYDDVTVREVLLTERTTLGQLYGFIVGKAVRARQLHLSVIDAFESHDTSPQVVSCDSRIVALPYFYQDVSFSTYFSIVSALAHDDELSRIMSDETMRNKPIRDLAPDLRNLMQVGRSRARARILDTLMFLRSLNLVTPLHPSDSATPWMTCAPNGEHPIAYDLAPLDGWNITAPVSAPLYWRFNDEAPLYLWAVSETTPPFWKDVQTSSSVEAVAYWQQLQTACIDSALVIDTPPDTVSATGPLNASMIVARSLRRPTSWQQEYVLTWHQMQYLKRFVDVSTAITPMERENGGADELQRISWVVSAPRPVVEDYLMGVRTKFLHELDKARRKTRRKTVDEVAKQVVETKASLARKAAEARLQREKDWDILVDRMHPAPLKGSAMIRIKRVRSRFIQSGSGKDIHKWEAAITEAIQDAAMPSKRSQKRFVVPKPFPFTPTVNVAPPPVVSNPPERSIESLIAEQGTPISQKASDTKNKRRKGSKMGDTDLKGKTPARRHRFLWTHDYEELARDASAIIRARCRNAVRLDLSALEQVFPAVPRNSVRQRIVRIRESPGGDAYLNRLEDKWYELWLHHRGTTALPDDDPHSASNFNLIKHIEFLRQHVDKNALRVGFVQPQENSGVVLSASLDELRDHWDVIEVLPSSTTWDFMWNAVVEEGREKRALRHAFSASIEDMPLTTETSSNDVSLAESALKMVLGTPSEHYDPEVASRLLRCVGDRSVTAATKNLSNRGVVSKLVRDPQKQVPGRQLKISEGNQNALGGPIPRDMFQDAIALEDISAQDDNWREWPLFATDGDLAALIEMVSDDKVDFRIDTTQAQAARPGIDWNSKKADDDNIETMIHVRFHDLSRSDLSPMSSPTLMPVDVVTSFSEHGRSINDDSACCRRDVDGLVDCLACMDEESSIFMSSLDQEDTLFAQNILAMLRQAGSKGITKKDLLKVTTITPKQNALSMVRRMSETSIPLVFCVGYSSLVLVSSLYLRNWTVVVSESPRTYIFPRRWLSITGLKIIDVWEAAVRSVVGVLIFRPGISQAEIRWRLRSVYDRQEIIDILRFLQDEGLISVRYGRPMTGDDDLALDDGEEKYAFWFIGETKHWYQV